jgi:hypothetical protein
MRARESLVTAGAWRTDIIRHAANGHLMGTARMGANPASSVVDADCRAHDVPNLLVPDGSAFVTAGSANPTTTIAAVALRAAERLLARRADLPRPSHHRSFASFNLPPSRPQPTPVATPVRLPTDEQRARLRALADRWIPAADGMPSASAAGAVGDQLDRVLRTRPDLGPQVDDALAQDGSLPDEAVRTLRYAVAAAYYLAPGVRAALGYDPQRVTPVRPLDFPDYLEEGLLDHLLEATS